MDCALTALRVLRSLLFFLHKLYRATCTIHFANSALLALNLYHCDRAIGGRWRWLADTKGLSMRDYLSAESRPPRFSLPQPRLRALLDKPLCARCPATDILE